MFRCFRYNNVTWHRYCLETLAPLYKMHINFSDIIETNS